MPKKVKSDELRVHEKNNGFTLIELLVVIAIIAILAAVGFATYSGVQKNARDSKRQTEINAIANALEIRYQISSGGTCPGGGTPNGGTYCPLQASWFANNVVPTDTNASVTPYCIWWNLNSLSSWTTAASNIASGACTITGAPGGTEARAAAVNAPDINEASYWRVCAILEKTGQPYCVNSKQ